MTCVRQALLILVVGMIACGPHRAGSDLERDSFAVVVINHHWLDVTVYLVHDGQRTRVGTVTATTTEQFAISTRLLGASRQISLLGEAVGSNQVVRTELLTVQAGQYIEWTLENALRRSSVAVY
jgi:hypothetical protein